MRQRNRDGSAEKGAPEGGPLAHTAFCQNLKWLFVTQSKEGNLLTAHATAVVNFSSELTDVGKMKKDKHFAVIILNLELLPVSCDSLTFLIKATMKALQINRPLISEHIISMLMVCRPD